MTIIVNGNKFEKYRYKDEKEFEEEINRNAKTLLGISSIYIDAKKKIDSRSLGATIPDGFLFDFSDPTDPQFYIVEVELSSHSFYSHIFPQITKFFAFYNDIKLQKSLVEKLFTLIDSDTNLKRQFRKFLGNIEIYKFITDSMELNQNILLVCDGSIPELDEIMETYTTTWGRMVKFIAIEKYFKGNEIVYSLSPDVEALQYIGGEDKVITKSPYTEDFHLEKKETITREIYEKIKKSARSLSPEVIFNPQKYYISIRLDKNIAYLVFRKKKIRFIAMIDEEQIREVIKNYPIITLSQGVQDFYNGPCATIDIENLNHIEEINELMRILINNY